MADPDEIIKEIVENKPSYSGDPVEEHNIVYDSATDSIEPLYFWLLDKMNEIFSGGEFISGSVQKLVDNFSSSPGSGHFSELGAKATRMQEEAMKILGAVNQVIKSILNLIYDLKEWEIRLKQYEDARSKDKDVAEAGLLSLKQIWMDNVDIKRGIGSINQLSRGELMFSTLRDAFMMIKSPEDADELDLNDRVKRILKARIQEFLTWKEMSEKELKKRFEIEKAYLKSQVSSMQMYTRWVKPYLKAAAQLEMKDFERNPHLVTAFNTIALQLVLFAKKAIKPKEAAIEDKVLPLKFADINFKRNYYYCVLLEFEFRGIPQPIQRQQTHYAFGGKTIMRIKAYVMNEDEIALFQKKLEESEIEEAFSIAAGVTDKTLDEIKDDLEHFIGKEKKEEEEESEDVNPFSALFSFGKKKEEKKEIKSKDDISPDNYYEKILRRLAIEKAREICYVIYDIYKKAHDMASHPEPSYDYFNPDVRKVEPGKK